MREIKFRAWDKPSSTMYQWIDVSRWTSWNDEAKILMQFTGLKDKNGKEIYEGDIVDEFRKSRSFPEGRHIKKIIQWEDDMTLDDSYGFTAVGFNMFGGVLEVIGNIYENPNLLK